MDTKEKIREFIKNHGRTIVKVLLTIVLVTLLIFTVVKLTSIAVNYVKYHIAESVILAVVLVSIAYAIYKHKSTPPEPIIDIERDAAERTYINIAPVILTLLTKLSSVYPFVPSSKVSEIFSPARAKKRNGIWYYQYCAVKSGEIDKMAVAQFLKDELTRMLFDNEQHGLPHNTLFLEGATYAALQISGVQDVGTHILVDVVVMTKKYHSLMNYRLNQSFEVRTKEEDASDDEFIS